MSLKEFVGSFFGFDKELAFLRQSEQNIKDLLETEKNNGKLAESKLSAKNAKIEELSGKVSNLEKEYLPDPKETYWNNKYPKADITYRRKEQDRWYNIDVRNYFTERDSLIPTVSANYLDDIALKSLIYVHDSVNYVKDNVEYGFDEFWAMPYQTLFHKKGDCEDGAILLANILLRSGVPYWRIRLNVGNVLGGKHCYVTYCRKLDDEFVVLDWCYNFRTTPISERLKHSEERNYYAIDFSWNQRFGFSKIGGEVTGFGVNVE